MNTVEVFSIKELIEALKQEPKPTIEIKDPIIASAVRLLFNQRQSVLGSMSITNGGCIRLNPILEIIIAILSVVAVILLEKYCIHKEDKDRKWYDTFKDIFTFKYPYTGNPPYPTFYHFKPFILKPKDEGTDKK